MAASTVTGSELVPRWPGGSTAASVPDALPMSADHGDAAYAVAPRAAAASPRPGSRTSEGKIPGAGAGWPPRAAVAGGGDVGEGPVVAPVVGTAQVGDDERPGAEVGAGPGRLQRAMAGAGEHHGVVALAQHRLGTGVRGRFHGRSVRLRC